MRSKWMGVAMAAVMACGWASGAEAAEIAGTFRGVTTDASAQPVTVSFDITSPDFTQNGNHDVSFNFEVGAYSFSTTPDLKGIIYANYNFYQITKGNPFAGGSDLAITLYGPNTPDGTKGFLAFGLATKQQIDPAEPHHTISASDVAFFEGTLGVGRNEFGVSLTSLDVDGLVPSVSPVPLPATAPLFGAALLAVGGASYAHRRMSRARIA